MEAFNQVVADVRIAKLGLDVSLELAEEAIPLGVQLQNAGEAGQRHDTWCRGSHELLFAWHICSGERWCSKISGRAGDVIPRPLVIAALLMAIATLPAALIVVTSLATTALTALTLVIVVMTVATALPLTTALTMPLALIVVALVVALALPLVIALAISPVISMILAALAMTISATLTLLALASASVMTTPAASLAWGVTIRPFGMVCWPHVFRPVV